LGSLLPRVKKNNNNNNNLRLLQLQTNRYNYKYNQQNQQQDVTRDNSGNNKATITQDLAKNKQTRKMKSDKHKNPERSQSP